MHVRERFFVAALIGVFLWAMSAAGQEQAVRQIEITEGGTVHSMPSPLVDVVGKVNAGERYTILARSGPEWYKIDFHGQPGYVAKEITKLVPREPAVFVAPQPKPKPAAAPPPADKTAKPSTPVAKPPATKPAEKPADLEANHVTTPMDTLEGAQVTAEPPATEVTAKSGSHATLWMLGVGVAFLVVILVLVHFLRPEESPEEILHHDPH